MSCTVVAPRARDPLRVDGSSTLTRRRVDVLIIGWRHLSDEGGDGTGGAYDLPDPTVDEEASVADRKNAVRVTMRTSDQVRAGDEFATSERAKTDATFDRLDDRVLDPLDSLDLETSGLEIEVTADHVAAILQERAVAATKVYATLDLIGKDLTHFFPKVPEVLPAKIYGRLLNPNGTAAEGVSVRALEPVDDSTTPWPNPAALTDRRGSFALTLPPRPISENGMRLLVTGSNRIVELGIRRADLVAGNGDLGVLPLDQAVEPLPRSAVAQLGDVVVPTSDTDVLENPSEYAVPAPVVTLGDGDCAMSFRSNLGVIDKYRYSLLVRLVAPQLSNRRLGTRVRQEGRKGTTLSASTTGFGKYVGVEDLIGAMTQLGNWEIIERVPIDAPIDVDAFLDLVERDPKRVPKAASLGLGYVVKMHQIWIPTGLSLGDLVYSLPLAPGEQQRIAISDEREILSVREQEAMTAEEYQRYNEAADSSTNAVFRSAFDEAASGGSRMKVNTESGSFGGGLGVGAIFGPIVAGLGIGGGYSDSTTTGSTSSWQNASRDYVSNASQDFHSSLSRQASARREASRTSVRLASASEQRQVVTKVITNHNHNHALTMQYWQVLRHFGVSSVVDDVQLVCFVPLEVVRFLPSSQPRSLPTGTYNRNVLLARYSALLRYHDVIMGRVWRRPEMRHGLRVLQAFAGNPTMTVESSTGSAQDIVDVKITGTFLPCEDIYVTAFSTSGSRIGPVRMSSTSASVAGGLETRAALIQALRTRRTSTFETRSAGLTLPEHIARSDVARLEFSRTFTTFSYRLSLPSSLSFTDILSYLSNTSALDVTLTAADLEREVGGPLVNDPTAKINGTIELLESYNGPGGSETMTAVFPVAARRLAPELSFADLLRIEGVLQHVVQNTVEFSKAVWQSLTPEERAIMLESYTIGVPSGGRAGRNRRRPVAQLRRQHRRGVLRQHGDHAVLHPTRRRRQTRQDVSRGPGGPTPVPPPGVCTCAVVDHLASPRCARRGRARALRVQREDRPDEILELAGLTARRGDGSGDAVDTVRRWEPAGRARRRWCPSCIADRPDGDDQPGPCRTQPGRPGKPADRVDAGDQPAEGHDRDHPTGGADEGPDRDDRGDPQQDDRRSHRPREEGDGRSAEHGRRQEGERPQRHDRWRIGRRRNRRKWRRIQWHRIRRHWDRRGHDAVIGAARRRSSTDTVIAHLDSPPDTTRPRPQDRTEHDDGR